MSKAIIDEQYLTDIADAIRTKNGSADTYTPSEMATAIDNLPTPTPVTKGLVFSDYDADGYPTKAEFVGSWSSIPDSYLAYSNPTKFYGKIASLVIPEGVTAIGTQSFYQTSISVSFPSTLTSIGQNAFSGATIASFSFPSSLTTIGRSAFQDCKSYTSLTIPANIITINPLAFATNNAVTSVTYAGNVPNIQDRTFANCTSVATYDFSNATSVPSLYSVASLGHASGCVIKVPSALLSQWQTTAVWQDLTDVVWQGV